MNILACMGPIFKWLQGRCRKDWPILEIQKNHLLLTATMLWVLSRLIFKNYESIFLPLRTSNGYVGLTMLYGFMLGEKSLIKLSHALLDNLSTIPAESFLDRKFKFKKDGCFETGVSISPA